MNKTTIPSEMIWPFRRKKTSLTHQQYRILKLMAKGYKNKDIAVVLGLKEQTIKNHISAILRTMGVTTRTAAAMKGIKEGMVKV